MRIKLFVFISFTFQNTVATPDEGAQADEVCGEVALTYFLQENRIAARLTFVPSTELAWYRWVHFFIESGPQPDFDFQDALRMNAPKYEKHNFSLIIKDLQASDNGVYNLECKNVNGRHLFSDKLKINKPYILETTPITSTLVVDSEPKHSDKAKRDSDLKPLAENCNLCKTITESDGISTTDKVHTTQTITESDGLSTTDKVHTTQTDSEKNHTADIILTEPYTVSTTPIPSITYPLTNQSTYVSSFSAFTEDVTVNSSIESDFNDIETTIYYEEAKSDADLKPTAEYGNFNKTETHSIVVKEEISTTDMEHTTQADATLKVTVENETADINETGNMNATTEKATSVQEQKWLNMKTFLWVGSSCTVCGFLVIIASVIVAKTLLRSNEEDINGKKGRYDLTTLEEQTEGNTYCVTVAAEMKTELQTFSHSKSSTQDPSSTSTFINTSNENDHSELKDKTTQIEYYDNMN